jgi:hypothetical protein
MHLNTCNSKYIFQGFLIAALFFLLTSTSVAQNHKDSVLNKQISIKFNNTPTYRALFELSNKIDLNFSYNSDLIDEDKTITLDLKNIKLTAALDSILRDSLLRYDVVSKHIIIYEKGKKNSILTKKDKAEKKIIKIKNRVLDEEDKKPLPYTNVGIDNHSIGTITNEDGEFVLKIDSSHLDDTLVVTYLGYKNEIYPIKDFINEKTPVFLEKKSFSLQEVIVRWTDPYTIVLESISNISSNYFQRPLTLTSFYRESIRKENNYTSISEAIMEIYKPHNKLFQKSKIKVLKSRKSINYGKEDKILLKLKSGLEAILLLDIIKENISFLNNLYIDYYQFEFNGITYFNDNATYIINFSPKKNDVEIPLYTGKLYIDVRSLAIIEAEFHLDNKNLDKISNSLVVKKKGDIKVKPKQVEYMVNYKQMNGKYHLNHIRGELLFKVRESTDFLSDKYQVAFEMFTSNTDTSVVNNFNNSEITQPHKIFIEEINNYDADFWGEYNYIIPEEPIRETVEKMSSQIKMLKKK